MTRIIFAAAPLVLAATLVAGGCAGNNAGGGDLGGDANPGGDTDPAVESCFATEECPFGKRCIDGLCSAAPLPPQLGCLDDSECGVDEKCAPSVGRCRPIAPAEEPIEEAAPICLSGQTRLCGTKIGICEYGTERCVDSVWSGECNGGTRPATSESCNALDDDCDGLIPQNELDVDGDGVRPCNGDCDDGDPEVYTGNQEVCDGKDNDCSGAPDENTDSQCDDGLHCNGAETCQTGACQPGPAPDCTGLTDVCNTGACSEALDACEARPRADGTTCDDGLYCTVTTSCQAGSCVGAARNCTGAGDECNAGICDEEGDACVADPLPDGSACDELFCKESETCLFDPVVDPVRSRCQGGTDVVCGASGCRDGTCDEATQSCIGGDPINEGLSCNDGQYCTVNDVCTAGECGGGPRDCVAQIGDQCNSATCNELTNTCVRNPTPFEGQTCDDAQFCTVGETCAGGSCTGGALRNCSSQNDACNNGTCSESADACVKSPKSDGVPCDDAQWCTVNDGCSSGTCTGAARDCSAVANQCNNPSCIEATDTCQPLPKANGTPCSDGQFCSVGDACNASGTCVPGAPRDCSAVADLCNDGICDDGLNQCVPVENGLCVCDTGIDADFDGANQCNDCDETNGGVFPGAPERCNGIDDDCDVLVDEDFDQDLDTYSVCAIDPTLFDCNDLNPAINPGALENCGAAGTGNGIDDNCNGYIDEGCNPCDPVDTDGDGWSECDGDCDPAEGAAYPGGIEVCDGVDNDCNVFTIENCDVSDPCNIDGDDDFSNDADVCMDDLLCACIVNGAGNCTGDWQCTSYCNTSATGPTGDGCTATQTCSLDLLQSANVHGCDESPTALGAKAGGVNCSGDSECRSSSCIKLFVGPGQNNYCYDYCGSDAYCPASGTVCRLYSSGSNMDGRCWPTGRPGTGTTAVGGSCTTGDTCDHGFCADEGNNGSKNYCTEACCKDSDCPSAFTCSLRGDQLMTNYVHIGPNPPACTSDANCPNGLYCLTSQGVCSWVLAETSPMCLRDVSGQSNRPAGAACALNRECASNFCERSINVCVDVCCSDASCPNGLTCELQTVETATDPTYGFRLVSASRVCMNLSTDEVLSPK